MTNSEDRRPWGRPVRTFALLLLVAVSCLCCCTGKSAGSEFHLSMGYMASVYQDFNNKDISAAVGILAQKIAWKHLGKGEARFYDSLPVLEMDVKNKRVQVLATPPEEFIELRNHAPIDPVLVATTDKGHEIELLLLVRKDSGIRTIRDLKNRTVSIPRRNDQFTNMFQVWLETLIMREGGRSIDTFFSSVKETRTIAKVIMPVFFRQADVCVISRQAFDLTAELNPQIGKELTAIARIGKLSQGIIAIDRRLPEETRQKIIQAFQSVHETPDGQQLLMLFKVRKLVPFRPEYLKATEALFAEYRERRARLVRK